MNTKACGFWVGSAQERLSDFFISPSRLSFHTTSTCVNGKQLRKVFSLYFSFNYCAEQMLGAGSSDLVHAISTQWVRARINSTIWRSGRHNNYNGGGYVIIVQFRCSLVS